MIVTVANLKGGVGKTTASVFLAHALAEATGAPCTLIDADPHASAWQWARRAAQAGQPMSVPVLAQPTPTLALPVSGAPNVVIDTPPAEPEIVAAAHTRTNAPLRHRLGVGVTSWVGGTGSSRGSEVTAGGYRPAVVSGRPRPSGQGRSREA